MSKKNTITQHRALAEHQTARQGLIAESLNSQKDLRKQGLIPM